MLQIGDRITVDNFASRHTSARHMADNEFYAWWEPEICTPFTAIFIGWKYVYSGAVQTDGSHTKYHPAHLGKMLTRTAIRVAMVQPLAGQQWRRPRATFIAVVPPEDRMEQTMHDWEERHLASL